jgi:tetratricopeptide (TPR) repeat protein
VARRFPLLLAAGLLALNLAAQKPQPEEPPEEDETIRSQREYTFNPIQAEEEVKVGRFYWKKGSYRAAALRFEEATRWNPTFAEAFLLLGEAQQKLDNREEAVRAYEKYLELEPDAKKAGDIRKRIRKLSPRAARDISG